MIHDDISRGHVGGTPGYSYLNQGPQMAGTFDRSSITGMGGN